MMWWLLGCATTDGPVGAHTLAVANESDQDLDYTAVSAGFAEQEVLAAALPAGETTDVLRQGGCFGCADPIESVVARFTVSREDGTVVVDLDPVTADGWSTEAIGEYDVRSTLAISQAQVDATTP